MEIFGLQHMLEAGKGVYNVCTYVPVTVLGYLESLDDDNAIYLSSNSRV